MNLASYINDLLYRYDCVIVPNFGGFIANKVGAVLNEETQTFFPPTKKIGFNANLKHNDGLLANYIASAENISFQQANTFIDTEVYNWQTQLETEALEILKVGVITKNEEKQLVFEPNTDVNFLTTSFGLSSVTSVSQERYQEKVIPLHTSEEVKEASSENKVAGFIKYAAAAAIVLTLGTIGFNQYQKTQEQSFLVQQQEKVEQKIQEATFVIDNPLPTINLNIEKENTKMFHVVAGAFQSAKNADKKVSQLQNKGYKASVLGLNSWGLTQVAFDSYETKQEARQALEQIKTKGFKDAWLLIKKFD